MEGRLDELLERIAVGVEKMASDPEIEIEGGPPMCPTCGEFDPTVILPEQEAGQGPLSQIAIEAVCTHCGSTLFAVVESYSMHSKRDMAVNEMKQRAEGIRNGQNVQ